MAISPYGNPEVWELAQIHIADPANSVWSVLTDFQNWPVWNKKVTKMRLNGQLALSGEIHWKRWGVPVVSFIQSVEPTQHIKWAWRSLGMRAIRVWSVIPAKDGVIVHTEQIYAGLLAAIFAPLMRLAVKHSLNDELSYLKHECEAHQNEH